MDYGIALVHVVRMVFIRGPKGGRPGVPPQIRTLDLTLEVLFYPLVTSIISYVLTEDKGLRGK